MRKKNEKNLEEEHHHKHQARSNSLDPLDLTNATFLPTKCEANLHYSQKMLLWLGPAEAGCRAATLRLALVFLAAK